MARFESNTPEGQRVKRVKLDGVEVWPGGPGLFIKAADTDEGWLDFYETELVGGKRRLKMTPWQVESEQKQTRTFIITRLHGKVEVE